MKSSNHETVEQAGKRLDRLKESIQILITKALKL